METSKVYCQRMCPFMGDQLHVAHANSNQELPRAMCPRVAALAVQGFAQNIVGPKTDDEVSNRLGEQYLGHAEDRAKLYDQDADKCAKKLVRTGTDNTSLDEVRTVTDADVLRAFSMIGELVMPGDFNDLR